MRRPQGLRNALSCRPDSLRQAAADDCGRKLACGAIMQPAQFLDRDQFQRSEPKRTFSNHPFEFTDSHLIQPARPADGMEKMKYDMAGGAAMIGAMRAIAQLKPAIPVTAFIPCVENMPGSRAQRPGE